MKDRVKTFVKEHKYEIALVGLGVVVGTKHTKKKLHKSYEKDVDRFIERMNQELADAFTLARGNFQTEDGKGYHIPYYSR